MKNIKSLVPKAMWIGTIGLGAILLGWTPSCKAQEVSPAIFTDSGVEDVYPAAKPVAKKPVKTLVAGQPNSTVASNQMDARKLNAHRVARKTTVAASNL